MAQSLRVTAEIAWSETLLPLTAREAPSRAQVATETAGGMAAQPASSRIGPATIPRRMVAPLVGSSLAPPLSAGYDE